MSGVFIQVSEGGGYPPKRKDIETPGSMQMVGVHCCQGRQGVAAMTTKP